MNMYVRSYMHAEGETAYLLQSVFITMFILYDTVARCDTIAVEYFVQPKQKWESGLGLGV